MLGGNCMDLGFPHVKEGIDSENIPHDMKVIRKFKRVTQNDVRPCKMIQHKGY